MKKLLLLCIASLALNGQSSVIVSGNVVTATAGTLACTFTNTTRLVITCTSEARFLSSMPHPAARALPIFSPGWIASVKDLSGNIITWGYVPWNSVNAAAYCPTPAPTSGTCWQIVANGTSANGAF